MPSKRVISKTKFWHTRIGIFEKGISTRTTLWILLGTTSSCFSRSWWIIKRHFWWWIRSIPLQYSPLHQRKGIIGSACWESCSSRQKRRINGQLFTKSLALQPCDLAKVQRMLYSPLHRRKGIIGSASWESCSSRQKRRINGQLFTKSLAFQPRDLAEIQPLQYSPLHRRKEKVLLVPRAENLAAQGRKDE